MACGAASLYVPRYLSEIAPVAIRGGIATLNQARPDTCALGMLTCPPLKPCPSKGALSCCAVTALMRALPMQTKCCHAWIRAPEILTEFFFAPHDVSAAPSAVLCVQVFICMGILVAYIVGLPYDANQPFAVSLFGRCVAWWRIIFGLGVVPALLQARAKDHYMPLHLSHWSPACAAFHMPQAVLTKESKWQVSNASCL